MAVTSIYDAGKSRQEIRGFVLYRRPSDFRFQGVGPGGNSLFEMVVKTDSFELYVPADSKILKGGRACLSERFPDVAEMEGLIPIALLQWKDVRVMSVSDSRDATSVALAFRGGQWKALLEPKKLLLKRLDRIVAGKTDLSAEFTDFGDGEYGWLPRRFDVQSLSGGWRTIVKIDKFEINPFLVENNFKLQTSFSPKIEECK